jgi:benzoylformate decarboxylase
MMTVQGLWTAANDGIPVVYVVCNNAEYRILKVNMDIYKDLVLKQPRAESQYMGMDFPVRPNFAQIAEAMGVHGRRIDDPAQVGPAMTEALSLGKPALLDIVIGNQ